MLFSKIIIVIRRYYWRWKFLFSWKKEEINGDEEIIQEEELEENIVINKKIIFNIIKLSNKRGRYYNSYKEKHKDANFVHGKTSNDNIIRKFKTRFTNSF